MHGFTNIKFILTKTGNIEVLWVEVELTEKIKGQFEEQVLM
jgi:hypothetical protein